MARAGRQNDDGESTVKVERVRTPTAREPVRRAVKVGSVHDPAEHEADRLADHALAVSADYATAASAQAATAVHRSPTRDVDGLHVDERALDRASNGGRTLDGGVRDRLETGFGRDLGGVRIHTGPQAAEVAEQIHAKAFTRGSDVFFGAGEYRPGTPDGDHVLAHEVAHTVQAGGNAVHRFPATWTTTPVPWKALTGSVFRPGEGASGGVYILTTNDPQGAVKKAVAKPVFGQSGLGLRETGEQLQFSDKALGSLLGLASPQSKVVQKGTAEFQALVDVCRTKQPQPQPGEDAVSLADAESFLVMSEVPNAKSIGSMADKAATNKTASAELWHSVFNDGFLMDLGKLCIGDLLLGNPDRMVYGAMNFGNVMVSMEGDNARLAAIDTAAYLPTAVSPTDIAKAAGQNGFNTLKSHIDAGPGALLDDFFGELVKRMKRGTPADAGPMPAWQLIESTYKSNRDRWVSSFEFGWNDAMITAMSLADDRGKADQLTGGYNDENITSDRLMSNLSYVGGRAMGSKSHDEAVGRSLAIMARSWVASLDQTRLVPPGGDELSARSQAPPTGKVVKAEVVPIPSLPSGSKLKTFDRSGAYPLSDSDYGTLPAWVSAIAKARGEVDHNVARTKRRRKGLFGGKEDVPRNRSLVSHYVVHATAMGAGAGRVGDAAGVASNIATESEQLKAAEFRGAEAAPVKSLLTKVGATVPVLATTAQRYKREIDAARPVLPQTGHPDKAALVASLDLIDARLDRCLTRLGELKKLNLQRRAANL